MNSSDTLWLVLEDRDIIQIDATVIAGALVYLTISTASIDRSEIWTGIGAVVTAVGAILLFGLSAVQVASGSKESGMGTVNFAFKFLVGIMLVQMVLILWSLWPQIQIDLTNILKWNELFTCNECEFYLQIIISFGKTLYPLDIKAKRQLKIKIDQKEYRNFKDNYVSLSLLSQIF
jgi:hypothetical protein